MKEMDEEKIVGGFRKALHDFLVPELREVVGELKQMNKRLTSVENSIPELKADIREDRREVLQKIDDSHEKTREVLIEEIRKSAKLEVRIDEIEKRIGYIDQLNYRIQSIFIGVWNKLSFPKKVYFEFWIIRYVFIRSKLHSASSISPCSFQYSWFFSHAFTGAS